jgi:ligand-binding SRPBCC domain-containing protein
VKVHLLERSQRVDIPVKRAFDFYADTNNLEPMTPPWLHFRLTNEGQVTMEEGALLDYALRLHGVPIRWTTRIETWSPPTGFVDTQLDGPYAHWEHTHIFEEDGESATVIHDRVRYAIPFGPLGAFAHLLFVRRDLRRIFDYRAAAFSRLVFREGLPVAE